MIERLAIVSFNYVIKQSHLRPHGVFHVHISVSELDVHVLFVEVFKFSWFFFVVFNPGAH